MMFDIYEKTKKKARKGKKKISRGKAWRKAIGAVVNVKGKTPDKFRRRDWGLVKHIQKKILGESAEIFEAICENLMTDQAILIAELTSYIAECGGDIISAKLTDYGAEIEFVNCDPEEVLSYAQAQNPEQRFSIKDGEEGVVLVAKFV